MAILGFVRQDLQLLVNLCRMQVRDRYLGSVLGLLWAVLQPVLFFGIYTFVFAFVFKARIPGADTTFAYVVWLVSGLVPYQWLAEASMAAANSVIGGAGMVKNMAFKTEALPVAAVMAAGVPCLVGLVFLAILLVVDGNYPTWHAVLLIPVLAVQFVFLCGMGLMLSATTVFLRDLSHALPMLIQVVLFATPVFYAIEMLPGFFQRLTFFNPFYQMICPYRAVLVEHRCPDLLGLGYLALLSMALLVIGLGFFRRLKGYFEAAL